MQSMSGGVNYGAGRSWLTGGRQKGQYLVVSEVYIPLNLHRRNPPPFSVKMYLERVDYLVDERLFEETIEGPSGVPKYSDFRGNERIYLLCSWQDRLPDASPRTFRYSIDGPTDITYAWMAEL